MEFSTVTPPTGIGDTVCNVKVTGKFKEGPNSATRDFVLTGKAEFAP